jgi:hypothetical protein
VILEPILMSDLMMTTVIIDSGERQMRGKSDNSFVLRQLIHEVTNIISPTQEQKSCDVIAVPDAR